LVFLSGGQLFLDDKFGNIVSNIGRRRSVLPENILSEKYNELTARFKSNIHRLYENLFEMEKEALIALQKGEKNLEDKIRSFYNQMNDIRKQVNQWATETKYDLEMHAVTMQGDWVHLLNQYTQC
jgi:S-adenosylmethionine hydrolase